MDATFSSLPRAMDSRDETSVVAQVPSAAGVVGTVVVAQGAHSITATAITSATTRVDHRVVDGGSTASSVSPAASLAHRALLDRTLHAVRQ
jgi:hypothetical protein